ncbi:prolyl aminopeptidase [Terricaulis sp.]|uniref:prolyl aminopeptidase n=1 Tax=Terricaulis sp. TaxID=2768686 RepID=UPI002AC41D2D|nr:prolyl aminopeptidase [Terricaulis sp.]MDZ4692016.1 prolyl aminopeptidase [Terricaulis sp.]
MYGYTPPHRRDLYPAIEANQTEMLKVSDLHTVYVEQSGNRSGLPAVALHGGPGGGSSPEMRRFFDPKRYRVVMMDQRGCGRSTPHAELRENTTWDLVADIERVREKLGIEKWLVFGGSWGSTLALAYAAKHPERVAGLVLRGIFTLRKSEIDWFYQNGASQVFPDAFARYAAAIPEAEHGDFLAAYHKRLTSPDWDTRLKAARAWARWEGETISIAGPSALPSRFNEDRFVEAFARIENHYFVNHGFFEHDGWLLDQAPRMRAIPCRIAQGRYDMCTPLTTAWELKQRWPEAELEVIHDAGHSSLEPGIVDALIRATDWMADKAAW